MIQNYKLHGIMHVVFYVLTAVILVSGCANQQPPGGGEEDKTPPKVKIISPKPNSTNFGGNSISFEFDEYVDRRSFQDAFRISPQIKGDLEFDWGGKDVEVIFPKSFRSVDANKTFVVNISSSLKDIRGNPITTPVNFAFSTGSKIDLGGMEGRVYNNNSKTISILAYSMDSPTGFDPTKNIPDYLTETSSDGSYVLTNLAGGKYRVISITDDDRNLLFTAERESYGVLPFDVNIRDSVISKNINFYMKDISQTVKPQPELDYTKYFKDSSGIVFTSVEKGSVIVLPEQSIFIFFNKYKPSRDDLVNSLKITDENGTGEKVVFNWRNDSLVEIFSANKFASNRKYFLSFSLKTTKDSLYEFKLPFRTVSSNSFGDLKGVINSGYDDINIFDYTIKIEMTADSVIPQIKYQFETKDSVFNFKKILESKYSLFSYVDINNNSEFDFGYPFPFEYSEPFYIYSQPLNIKGGWTVENVAINFIK